MWKRPREDRTTLRLIGDNYMIIVFPCAFVVSSVEVVLWEAKERERISNKGVDGGIVVEGEKLWPIKKNALLFFLYKKN